MATFSNLDYHEVSSLALYRMSLTYFEMLALSLWPETYYSILGILPRIRYRSVQG